MRGGDSAFEAPAEGSVDRLAPRHTILSWLFTIAVAMVLVFDRRPMLSFVEVWALPERILNVLVVGVAPIIAVARMVHGGRDLKVGRYAPALLLATWVTVRVATSPASFWTSRTEAITVILAVLLPTQLRRNELRQLRHSVLLLGGLFSVLALLFATPVLADIRSGIQASRLGIEISAANAIILPRALYIVVITGLYSLISEKAVTLRVFSGSVVVVPMLVALATGGRGPLLGIIVAAVVVALSIRNNRVLYLGGLAMLLLVGYRVVIEYLPALLVQRVEVQDAGRFELWADVFAKSKVSLLGMGLQDDYPHNVFLEFAYNYGLVGLVLFFWFLTGVFRSIWRELRAEGRSDEVVWVVALITIQFVAQQVSLDIFYGAFWAALLLALVFNAGQRREGVSNGVPRAGTFVGAEAQ